MLPTLDKIESAVRSVQAVMPPTPQFIRPLLSERFGAEVWRKHDNHTPVGAFKVRGGQVYFDNLARRDGVKTVVTGGNVDRALFAQVRASGSWAC